MACIIVNENKVWYAANWVFEYIVSQAIEQCEIDDEVRQILSSSLVDGSHWLSFQGLEARERELARERVSEACRRLVSLPEAEDRISSTSEGREALRDRCKELLLLIDSSDS
jgi:hypothetical protein